MIQRTDIDSWAAAHDAASATHVYNNDVVEIYRGRTAAPTYFLGRSGIVFPVSSGLTIISASIFLYGNSASGDEFPDDIVLVDGSDLADTLVVADYGDLLNDIISYGSINSNNFVAEGWNEIALNASGIAALQAASTAGNNFRLGVRLGKDISDTAPTLSHYDEVIFYGSNSSSSLFKPWIVMID